MSRRRLSCNMDAKDETIYQKVREYVRRHGLLDRGDRVIAGISGGADSICLLFMLLRLGKELDFSVAAVHVHHGLRGAAADADAAYVGKLCGELGTELQTFREDVRAYADRNGLSLEEAGREVRREVFLRVLRETGGTKIALAHHQNDNAETLIWNLCRGCGLRGAGGIAPVAGQWIRPLLCLKREEIESYLENRGISYCTDETNLADDYTRNRIRNHVIPYLEQQVNSRAVLHMSEAMEQMRMAEAYMEQEAQRCAKTCVRCDGNSKAVLDAEKFRQVPEALKSYVLRGMLCHVAGKRKDIGAVHVSALAALLGRQVGRQLHLPYGMCARRSYEGLELEAASRQKGKGQDFGREEYVISGEMLSQGTKLSGVPVRARVFDRPTGEPLIFPENPYTKWFDYDIIKNVVKIRHREPGDEITVRRDGGTQKLKQYFINEKVPAGQRDGIWLAADGKHIMWIVGYRQSWKYQITDKTRRILELEFYGGQDDGGKHQSNGIGSGCCEED